jgi:hypothetical protein
MKYAVPVLLIALAIAVAGTLTWLFVASSPRGAGSDLVTERRTLPPFTRIVIEGIAEVTLVQGDGEAVTVEGQARHLASVRTEVSGGALTITGERSRRWWSGLLGGGGRPVRITVACRELEAITATGAVKVRAEHLRASRLDVAASGATSLRITALDAKELSVTGSGAMKAEVGGRAISQRISISGAGDYRGPDLVSEAARVAVSGAGRAVVHAERTLDIRISGAGTVEYLGNPQVTQTISGAGRVKRREASDAPVQIASVSLAR